MQLGALHLGVAGVTGRPGTARSRVCQGAGDVDQVLAFWS